MPATLFIPHLAGTALAARLPTLVHDNEVIAFDIAGAVRIEWRQPFGLPAERALVSDTDRNLALLDAVGVPRVSFADLGALTILPGLLGALLPPVGGAPDLRTYPAAQDMLAMDVVTLLRLCEAIGASTRHAPAGPPRLAVDALASVIRSPDA